MQGEHVTWGQEWGTPTEALFELLYVWGSSLFCDVSWEILTLLLHHWRIRPLIVISCFSCRSQPGLTSLTRPLSLTMLVTIGQTVSVIVCVHVCVRVKWRKWFSWVSRTWWLSSHLYLRCVVCGVPYSMRCSSPFHTQRRWDPAGTALTETLSET